MEPVLLLTVFIVATVDTAEAQLKGKPRAEYSLLPSGSGRVQPFAKHCAAWDTLKDQIS